MTIPVSTIPQALTYLQAAIEAQIAQDEYKANIYLCLGDPGIPDPPDIIQVASAIERTPSHFSLVGSGGKGAVYEKYAIIWRVSAAKYGDTEADISEPVTQRAWQLVGYIEAAVRTDPSFGGLLVEGWPGQTTGGIPLWSEEGGSMICEVTGRVLCEASI